MPKKENWVSFVVICLFSLTPACLIGMSKETIELFYKAISNLNTIILALLAVIFTGYALFQALINPDLLKRLINSNSKVVIGKKEASAIANDQPNKSKLQESNEYFINIMMLYVLAIIINALLLLVIGSLPSDFILPFSRTTNNTFAAIAMWIYFSFTLLITWEMKCFIFNMFQLFNASAGSKAIEIMRDEPDEYDDEMWDD